MSATLRELADLAGARLVGEADRCVARVAPLEEARADAVAFCADERHLPALRRTRAAGALVRDEHVGACPATALVVDDPYYAYAAVAQHLHPPQRPAGGVHPAATVAGDAELGAGASVAAHAVVAA
ncbi:MAG: LpxD N-terminal domain-containing protein, partial [Halorhodospira sp.]